MKSLSTDQSQMSSARKRMKLRTCIRTRTFRPQQQKLQQQREKRMARWCLSITSRRSLMLLVLSLTVYTYSTPEGVPWLVLVSAFVLPRPLQRQLQRQSAFGLSLSFIPWANNNNKNKNRWNKNNTATATATATTSTTAYAWPDERLKTQTTTTHESSSSSPPSLQSYSSQTNSSSSTTQDSNGQAISESKSSSSSSLSSSMTESTTTAPPITPDTTTAAAAAATTTTTFLNASLTEHDLQQIEQYFDALLPDISYLGTQAVSEIYQALVVAYRAHRGQMRKSGEPFIVHPVQVATLLAGLKMDAETIMAGLLHDTVEDTDMTFEQVEAQFGATVRGIVEGETKVSKLPKMVASYENYADEQAENLRQMFVAMTDDYRIIIVKLADRLHNMRTLQHMKPAKQIKISRETLDIFAPLAHRMGIWQFKSELEDTAFMYLYPVEYRRLKWRLANYQARFQATLQKSQALIQQQLNRDPTLRQQANIEVFGRTKEIYSLWHKMETRGIRSLDQVGDIVALRVIITPHEQDRKEKTRSAEYPDEDDASNATDRGVWLCYHVLGLVQHLPGFQPVPTRVKDYISFPKPNGYQSLHTALILNGQTIEVQIRTRTMHQVAEYGMASHWAYKEGKRRGDNHELYNTPWLASIKEWQNDRISSRDFVDSVRKELLGKRVFVFLRNGKILNLARGATAIDAAFAIHTAVGLSMYGVEINGKPVPFSYELQNGDVVSVLTGEQGKPATDWMRYAKSRSTRSKLRSYFRARQHESLRNSGRILLIDYLSRHRELIERESYLGFPFTVPTEVEDLEVFLPGKTNYETVDELLVAIGTKHDRRFLHKLISKMFEVPKYRLIASEDDRRGAVANFVSDVGGCNNYAQEAITSLSGRRDGEHYSVLDELNQSSQVDNLLVGLELDKEAADPDQICPECLPVYGDQVVGTRPMLVCDDAHDDDDESFLHDSSITMVHRIGCHHAQKAINDAHAEMKLGRMSAINGKPMVDSVTLRRQNDFIKSFGQTRDVPVKLYWSDDVDYDTLFLAEVVLHCNDRKLLLADCSEVVSETVEIVKTGSLTTEEHATLIFLVQVTDLHQLQDLMDRLGQVPSVMSVERRFGSELL